MSGCWAGLFSILPSSPFPHFCGQPVEYILMSSLPMALGHAYYSHNLHIPPFLWSPVGQYIFKCPLCSARPTLYILFPLSRLFIIFLGKVARNFQNVLATLLLIILGHGHYKCHIGKMISIKISLTW